MSKKKKRNYSNVDDPYIPIMNVYGNRSKRKIVLPAETPFSKDGGDSFGVIYADDYCYNNRFSLEDDFRPTPEIPLTK